MEALHRHLDQSYRQYLREKGDNEAMTSKSEMCRGRNGPSDNILRLPSESQLGYSLHSSGQTPRMMMQE